MALPLPTVQRCHHLGHGVRTSPPPTPRCTKSRPIDTKARQPIRSLRSSRWSVVSGHPSSVSALTDRTPHRRCAPAPPRRLGRQIDAQQLPEIPEPKFIGVGRENHAVVPIAKPSRQRSTASRSSRNGTARSHLRPHRRPGPSTTFRSATRARSACRPLAESVTQLVHQGTPQEEEAPRSEVTGGSPIQGRHGDRTQTRGVRYS